MAKSIVKAGGVTWDYLLDMFHEECRALCMERGAAFYRDRLNQFERWITGTDRTPESFTGHDLTRYLEQRRKLGRAQSTIVHDAKAVRKLFEFAHRTRTLPANPLRDYKVRSPARPHVTMPTQSQLDALIRAVEECWTVRDTPAIRFRCQKERTFYLRSHQAIIAGLIATGCRINEMLSLKTHDYDPAAMRIAVTGKGGTSRYVYFSSTWKGYVDRWLKVRPRFTGDAGFLFVNQYGGRIDYSRFRRSYDRYRQRAGMEGIKLHGIRHHTVTELAKTDPLMAQQQAGHRCLSTTMIYLHASQEHNRAKYAAADPLARVLVNSRSQRQKEKPVKVI